jgi:hypothetical protein
MNRDGLYLLSLIALAVAALTVGLAGWVLWSRDHRAWRAAHPHAERSSVAEGS